MMQIKFPFQVGGRGRVADCDDEEHIRDMIEQVLFTVPGERVNRPTLGCDILGLVFAPAGDALRAAAQVTVQSSLQQWLGDLIRVQGVEIETQDSTVTVTISYVIARTQQEVVAEFSNQSSQGGQSGSMSSAVSVVGGT
jgi:phage baseplate assembly protein W